MRLRPAGPSREVVVDPPRLPEVPRDDMRALVAAAANVRLDANSVFRSQISDKDWQREAWRHYDICGELRFAANRHAAALSQCRIYVAQVDKKGGPGEEVTEERLQSLGETVFGGPAAKAEALRTLGVDFYIGGEAYIVAEGATNPKSDVWYVVTGNQIKKSGTKYEIRRPQVHGGGKAVLEAKKDLLLRAWTPHPRDFDLADSPTRSVLPNLREIERLTQLTFSQIDSRLISAGLLLFPQGTSFPKPNGEPGTLNDLMAMVLEVAKAQLTGTGTAAGLVPIMAEVPADAAQKPEHLKFDTPIQAELKEKLEQAIRRLATGLDIAPEELLGQGDANHWGAWQIDESGIKLFIQPVMSRICDALTQGYLYPALKALGVTEPEGYTLWYDTSPLAVRPNRFEDAVSLYDKGLVDGSEVRKAGNFSDETAPKEKELAAQRAWAAIQLDPTLLQQDAYAKLVGLPVSAPPQPPGMAGPEALPPGPDAGGRDAAIADQLGLPATESGGASPAQQGLTAAGATIPGFGSLLPAAEQMVFRALEMAGGRMLDRRTRGQYADVPRHELHTRIRPTDRAHARRLLEGAFHHTPAMIAHFGHLDPNPYKLQQLLEDYCVELLVRGYAHESDYLETMLATAIGGVHDRAA
jgi:hypothetical protein